MLASLWAAALFKALSYLGLTLLLGGTLFRRAIGPRLGVPLLPVALGALLVALSALLEVTGALAGALGSFGWSDFLDYLLGSLQGQAALGTLALVAALLALEVQRLRAWAPSLLLGLLLLLNVALTSHGHASGPATYLLDVLHLVAMVAWTGAVLFLAALSSRRWGEREAEVRAAVERTSAVGLWSVVTLAATGTLAAAVHLPGLGALTGTGYGLTLAFKLAVFLAVLLLAAVNRFSLMRLFSLVRLHLALRVEGGLLLVVLALSGVLSSSALPTLPKTPALTALDLRFGAAQVRGALKTDQTGGLTAQVRVQGSQAPLQITLLMTDHPMPPLPLDFSRDGDDYTARAQLWMAGEWVAQVRLGGQVRRLPLNLR